MVAHTHFVGACDQRQRNKINQIVVTPEMCMWTALWISTRFHVGWPSTPMPGYNYHYQRWSILISNTLCSYTLTTPLEKILPEDRDPLNSDRFNQSSQSNMEWNGLYRMPIVQSIYIQNFKSRDDIRLLLNQPHLLTPNGDWWMQVLSVQLNAINLSYYIQTGIIFDDGYPPLIKFVISLDSVFHSKNCYVFAFLWSFLIPGCIRFSDRPNIK